jgi:hypothetical protein
VITDIAIVVAAALFIGVYVSWRAGRIDRLHARVDMAQAALDATLLRRSSVALELATSELLAEIEAAAHQVFLARKFYNDVVAATREARQRPLARVLRLSGRARAPEFFEMDDSLVAENTGAPLGL